MPCETDDIPTGEMVPGADLVIWWEVDPDQSDDDTADWDDLIVEMRAGATLLATSQGDDPSIWTNGAFVGQPGEVPPTDWAQGVFTAVVPASVTAPVTAAIVTVQAWTRKGGPDGPFYTEQFVVTPRVAVRNADEGS